MTNKKQDPYYQAQNILSRRDHSEAEVRQKMKRKGFRQDEINEVIDWLYAHNLLNDEIYAARYIESILLSRPIGPKWFQLKLKQRGVNSEIIDKAIADMYIGEKEEELAQQAVTNWLRTHKETENKREKLVRFILSRGFSYSTISKLDI